MEYTAIASWLNTTFAGFDDTILEFMNTLAIKAGGFLTPLMKVITFLGEKGIIFFLLALGLMCFSKTRKLGVCIFGAVCCGALITNIILKDLVARPRPFESMVTYKSFWNFIGSPEESGYSFPSGHVTAAAAGMGALCFVRGKKWILPSAIWVTLMCVSRNYLMAHYPSDVLFAAVIGIFAAFIAYLITRAIFIYLEDNDDFPLCSTILYFDLGEHLPSKDAVVAVINRTGKRSASGNAGSQRTARRKSRAPEIEEDLDAEDEPVQRRSVRRQARAELEDDNENIADGENSRARRSSHAKSEGSKSGGFKAALNSAVSAGSNLIDKVGGKRASDDVAETRAPRRKGASDWNNRWEQYQNSRNSAKRNNSDEPEAKVYTDPASAPEKAAVPVKAASQVDAVQAPVDDEDADMKIVGSVKAAKPVPADDEDVKVAAPREKKSSAELNLDDIDLDLSSSDIYGSDDGIDWKRLGIEFPDEDEAEYEAPVTRRRRSSSAQHASGSYRGRHEK